MWARSGASRVPSSASAPSANRPAPTSGCSRAAERMKAAAAARKADIKPRYRPGLRGSPIRVGIRVPFGSTPSEAHLRDYGVIVRGEPARYWSDIAVQARCATTAHSLCLDSRLRREPDGPPVCGQTQVRPDRVQVVLLLPREAAVLTSIAAFLARTRSRTCCGGWGYLGGC